MPPHLSHVAEEGSWRARFRREQLGPKMKPVEVLAGRRFHTASPDSGDVDSTTFTFHEVFAGPRRYRLWGRGLDVWGVYAHLQVSTTFPHERLKLLQVARRFDVYGKEYRTSFVGMPEHRLERAGFHDDGAPHRGWFVDIESSESAYWDEYRYAGRPGMRDRPAELLDSPGVGNALGGYEFWTAAVAEWEGRRRVVGGLWWGFEVDTIPRYWLLRSLRTSVYQPTARETLPPEFYSALDRWDGEPLGLEGTIKASRPERAPTVRNTASV